MWGDERFRRLSPLPPSGQSLWIYFLTCPETTSIPGLYRAGEAGIAEALGWSLKAFREAFHEVFLEGMVKADWEARIVWIPKAITFNKPESPNVVRGWQSVWDELPESPIKNEAYQHIKAFLEAFHKDFIKAFEKACQKPSRKALPNQEQEQDPEQEHEQDYTGSLRSQVDPTPCSDPKTPPYTKNHVPYKGRRNPPAVILTYEADWFQRLWDYYPNGQGKKAAIEAWEKLKPSEEIWNQIRGAVKQQKVSMEWQEEDGKYVPRLSNYLTGERWTDKEILPPKPKLSA